MKSIIRKAVSVSAAALMLSSAAIQVNAAENITGTKTVEYQFNKPYLNINVDGGNLDLSEVDFSLKNSDGEIVAKWVGGAEKFSEVADGLYDVSKMKSGEYNNFNKLPWDKFDKTELQNQFPSGFYALNYEPGGIHAIFLNDCIYPTSNVSFVYRNVDNLKTGETMTVPANTVVLWADEAYKTNGDDYSLFWLNNEDNDRVLRETFASSAGKATEYSLPAGTYGLCLGFTSGAGVGSTDFPVYDKPQEYVQIKFNMKDYMRFVQLDDDLNFVKDMFGHECICPTRGDKSDANRVCFEYTSGSVISAPIPDENGDVRIWIKADDLTVLFHNTYDTPHGFGGGTSDSLLIPKTILNLKAKWEYPTDGLTLYNIPAGDYTVEVDSTEYVLENNTIKVTDTKDMQSADVVLKKVEDPSSSETSSSEVSSSETSSSEVNSSETSSSEADSSDTDSSDTTSSVTDSKTTSSNSSSSSKTENKNSATNPSTGAAAGFAGIALIASAAVVVNKKNRN